MTSEHSGLTSTSDERDKFYVKICRIILTENPNRLSINRIKHKEGERIWQNQKGKMFRDEKGKQ